MIKTAVCYFSGSGNSFDISIELCKYLSVDSVFYIPNLDNAKLNKFDEIIIVSPIYQFNIPKNVQDFIRSLHNDKRYYVILNYAGIIGQSKSTIKKLFKQNRLKLADIKAVQMPSSFSIAFVPPKFLTRIILKKAKRKIERISRFILKNENKNVNLKRVKRIKKYVGYSILSNSLSSDSNCIECQSYVNVCPNKNIHLYQGKIEFGDRCTGCLSCYNRCEYVKYNNRKGKTYVNPNIDFTLMK